MNKKFWIMGYNNPDTDSIISSYCLAELFRKINKNSYFPSYTGTLQPEAEFVVDFYGLTDELHHLKTLNQLENIILVDTHYPEQLLDDLPVTKVREIFDHHPDTKTSVFSNAIIINENLGAAATLISELYYKNNITPTQTTSEILQLAIISNSLNFSAPSTSQRDLDIVNWLKTIHPVEHSMIQNMFDHRFNFQTNSPMEIILTDFKEYHIGNNRIGISQIEIFGIDTIEEVLSQLETPSKEVLHSQDLDFFCINIVDFRDKYSIVLAFDDRSKEKIMQILGENFDQHDYIKIDRILQRKSDFIPQLQDLLEN